MSFRASVLAGRVVRMSRVRGGMSSRFSTAAPLPVVVGGVDVDMMVDFTLDFDLVDEVEDEDEDGVRDSFCGSGGGT